MIYHSKTSSHDALSHTGIERILKLERLLVQRFSATQARGTARKASIGQKLHVLRSLPDDAEHGKLIAQDRQSRRLPSKPQPSEYAARRVWF